MRRVSVAVVLTAALLLMLISSAKFVVRSDSVIPKEPNADVDAPVDTAEPIPANPDLHAPGYMPAKEGPRAEPLEGGQLLFRSFQSPLLGRRMPYTVYLPPDYGNSDRRYPVLYLLHGYYGNYVEWADVGIHQTADWLILEDAIQPMIIVMPEGEQSYYVNHGSTGPRWGDYVLEDVVGMMDSTYRTVPVRDARAVGGLSMGGHAALQLAFRNPDIFGIVGAHSPTLRWDRPEDKFPFADDEYYARISPLHLARSADGLERLQIWIDVGDDDWNWFWVAELHDELEARGIDHDFALFPGGHEAEYWMEYQPQYLKFYDTAFRTGLAVSAR